MSSLHSISIRLGLIAAMVLVAACATSDEQARPGNDADAGMDTLVTAEWLSEHLGDPNLVVLDCSVIVEPTGDGGFRSVSGRANYEAGHIPSAGFADLMGDLSDGDSAYEFAMPTPEQFAEAMSALGVGDGSRVVLYDASNSVWAARVWWMLRWIGFDRAAVLDGGLDAWKAGGRPLSVEPAARSARTLTPAVRPGLIADRDEVLASIEDDGVSIIDSLPEGHYRGEWTMYDRPGHIRGASNVPVTSVVDSTGRFLPSEALRTVFEGDPEARTITYCGGGIAASSIAFALTRIGFTNVAIYATSLQEWTVDPANPMDTATEFDEFGD